MIFMLSFLIRTSDDFRRYFGVPLSEAVSPEKKTNPEEREVEVTVLALIPEYHQVKVSAYDGSQYCLTWQTRGVNLADLHEGQKLLCTITGMFPWVLNARVLA